MFENSFNFIINTEAVAQLSSYQFDSIQLLKSRIVFPEFVKGTRKGFASCQEVLIR